MISKFTLKECAEFCHKHQRRRAPNGVVIYRTQAEWNCLVVKAASKQRLYVVQNDQEQLVGVALATDRFISKTLWVDEIVCIGTAFKTFIGHALKLFPAYKIIGNRFGKTVTYTERDLHYGPKCSKC